MKTAKEEKRTKHIAEENVEHKHMIKNLCCFASPALDPPHNALRLKNPTCAQQYFEESEQ